jgi:hypothetical protein
VSRSEMRYADGDRHVPCVRPGVRLGLGLTGSVASAPQVGPYPIDLRFDLQDQSRDPPLRSNGHDVMPTRALGGGIGLWAPLVCAVAALCEDGSLLHWPCATHATRQRFPRRQALDRTQLDAQMLDQPSPHHPGRSLTVTMESSARCSTKRRSTSSDTAVRLGLTASLRHATFHAPGSAISIERFASWPGSPSRPHEGRRISHPITGVSLDLTREIPTGLYERATWP